MSLIPTRIHGMLDYFVGILFLVLPWLLGFHHHTTAATVFYALGAGAIVYSLLTRYELGLYPLLSMRAHIVIDQAAGLFLMTSPWLLGFADRVYWPHIFFGLVEFIVATATAREPAPAPTPLIQH